MNDLFLHDSLDTSPVVFSDRILYTPTSFAKTALLYLQEIGSLQAKKPHRFLLAMRSNSSVVAAISWLLRLVGLSSRVLPWAPFGTVRP